MAATSTIINVTTKINKRQTFRDSREPFIFLIVWRLPVNISFKVVYCSILFFWFTNHVSKIPWSCKRIEKRVLIFILFILRYAVKHNGYNLLGARLKIRKFSLKNRAIKTIISSNTTNFLKWDRKFHMKVK